MFVKICGITSREDALAAIDAGAGAVGFVFHKPSPRCVAIEPWIADLPAHVWKVGVFVDERPEVIEDVAATLKLDVAQLHGDETPGQYPGNLRIWKAIRVGQALPPVHPEAEAMLLDGPGNGQVFPWHLAKPIGGKIVIAGGLTPENVQAAIEQTNPWGVDTASGVESSPGRKNHARMKEFIKAALGS